MPFDLIITCKLGLESLLAEELRALGYQSLTVLNGEIHLKGDALVLARCNLWLRTAERVMLKLAAFPAHTFDALFEGVRQVEWGSLLPADARMRVMSTCIDSQLQSPRTTQSITKKAIVDAMQQAYQKDWFSEDGAEFKIFVDIIRDEAVVSLDSSGDGLHKRGYRAKGGMAPLRETLAAGIVMLSGWRPSEALIDPFCGSGTIPIEAAMIGANIAPGLRRMFAAESWPFIPANIWQKVREEAQSKIRPDPFTIHASDIDGPILNIARDNAEKAGVAGHIQFEAKAMEAFAPPEQPFVLISNPPYGERMEDVKAAETIYRQMGEFLRPLKGAFYILTPHAEFQRLFGARARKNRKLYNGKIRCYLYEY